MREQEVIDVLDEITENSTPRGKPSPGRLATIQAMVDLGEDWHAYREVVDRMQSYFVSGGVYVFELARKYPAIFEKDAGNRVRIRPEAFPIVSKHVGSRLKQVLTEAKKAKARRP